MRIVCRSCSAVQSVTPDGATSVCASCGAGLLDTLQPDERSQPADDRWHVMTPRGPTGPYGLDELAGMFDRGELAWTDHVWREGMRSFRPARREESLVVAIANARGQDKATQRLDMLPTISAEFERAAFDEGEDEEDDTEVDAIPAGLASSWPVRPGWASASRTMRAWGGGAAPHPLSSALRLATMALLAFIGGGLVVAISGRIASFARSEETAAAQQPTVPEPVQTASMLGSVPIQAPPPVSGERVQRALPALDEVRAELRRLGTSARRCVRDPKLGVELDITIAGDTGRPRQIEVRTPNLTPGAIECTRTAVEDLQVAPFTAKELLYSHRYAW